VRRDFTGQVSGHGPFSSLVEFAGGPAFSELRCSLSIALVITGFETDDRTVDDLAAQDFAAWFSNRNARPMHKRVSGVNVTECSNRAAWQASCSTWRGDCRCPVQPGLRPGRT